MAVALRRSTISDLRKEGGLMAPYSLGLFETITARCKPHGNLTNQH